MSAPLHLTLRVAGETVALPVAPLREILDGAAITRVPGAPAAFRGLMNLRGTVVPVVDLGVVLGLRAAAAAEPRCLVVLDERSGAERTVLALAADALGEIGDLAPSAEGVPGFGTRVPAALVCGLAPREGGFVPVIDVEQVMAFLAGRTAAMGAAAVDGGARAGSQP